jgi:hypothetical protein
MSIVVLSEGVIAVDGVLRLPSHDACGLCCDAGAIPNPIYHPEDALDGPEAPCPSCFPDGWNGGALSHPYRVLVACRALPLRHEDRWQPRTAAGAVSVKGV